MGHSTRFVASVAAVLVLVANAGWADSHEKAVLVTGANSGIGLKITEVLSTNGFHVYAGARKPADLERLDAMDNVSSIRLDVTVQDDIDAAVEFVREQGRGLWGVVNNAGVGSITPLATGLDSDMEFVFNVNVHGPFRINRAFLPMLEASGGRTTTIGSIAGYIAYGSGIYSMSKAAMEAYTDNLAFELRDSNVHISIVEPGGFRSQFRVNMGKRAIAAEARGELELTDTQRERYSNAQAREASIKEPDEVAEAVLELMTTDAPKRRYMVTPNKGQADMTMKAVMSKVVQLNADQPYSYTRDELVALLDEMLAIE